MKFILLLSLVFSPFMSLASKNGGGGGSKEGTESPAGAVRGEASKKEHLRVSMWCFDKKSKQYYSHKVKKRIASMLYKGKDPIKKRK